MRTVLLVLVLSFAGCAGVHYEPCPEADAGQLVPEDAQVPLVDAGSDAGAARWLAYGNVLCQLAAQRADALGCPPPVCPWDGSESCDPNRVRICVLVLALQSNSCPSLESAWTHDCLSACE